MRSRSSEEYCTAKVNCLPVARFRLTPCLPASHLRRHSALQSVRSVLYRGPTVLVQREKKEGEGMERKWKADAYRFIYISYINIIHNFGLKHTGTRTVRWDRGLNLQRCPVSVFLRSFLLRFSHPSTSLLGERGLNKGKKKKGPYLCNTQSESL
ncbi:unnamed protein product [Tuber aestivum]|uniref:Uncharacterized protein n=1 Tax=Tuber aestivum TaxID=59557 RepID=A0A292Q819_9PEZI|nr:unnamed protein product [Tuber aestivum]